MEFRRCSINGHLYGQGTTEIGRAVLKRKKVKVTPAMLVEMTKADKKKYPNTNFVDDTLTALIAR
jgi:hypothetical protein